MGLCKCPKKKVTNLFCFEHRVNVCENCLVANHQRCIVQSYLQWLQDSDYDPNCRLCGRSLADEAIGDTVRFTCYCVFHWNCVDNYARSLPSNTAPAGYSCPGCKNAIFPAGNVVSPVAEKLRDSLSKVNWARAGLGLDMIDEPAASVNNHAPPQTPPSMSNHSQTQVANTVHNIPTAIPKVQMVSADVSMGTNSAVPKSIHVGMEDSIPYDRRENVQFDPRKLYDAREDTSMLDKSDHDENKYKRRPALQWFARWFNSRTGKTNKKDPNAKAKKIAIIILIGLGAFLTMIIIFSQLGRSSADSDPFLDPMANPNIRINQK